MEGTKKYKVLGNITLNSMSIISENSIREARGGALLKSLGQEDNVGTENAFKFEAKVREKFSEYYCSKEVVLFTAVFDEEQINSFNNPSSDLPLNKVLKIFNGYPENELKFIKTPFSINILNDIQKKLCDIKDETGNPINYKYRGKIQGYKYGI